MANTGDEYGLFWNSQNGDREYNSDSLEIWLKKFFYSGVFNGDLAVTATTGMGISVGSGYANLQGKVKFFGTPTTFTLAAADPDNDRIDTVVVERDDGNRNITLKVVQGTPSATPTPIAPVRESGIYQLVLAQILVGSAVSSISQLDITDKRSDSTVCGWVASTVSEIDFDSMMAQYTAWFDEFTSHFDTDVALELQNEIDTLTGIVNNLDTTLNNKIDNKTFASLTDVNIQNVSYGQIVRYRVSDNKWVNVDWEQYPTANYIIKSTATNLSAYRMYLAATTVGSYALFGGGYGGSVSAVVDAYNTSLTRSTPTALSQARVKLAATTVGDYALFGGGYNYNSTNYNTVDAYNTSLTRSTPTALSVARYEIGATTVGNYALFGGGGTQTYQADSSVDTYNKSLTKGTATNLSGSNARGYVAAVTIGNYALFAGGASGTGGGNIVATVDTYNTSLTKGTTTNLSESKMLASTALAGNYAIIGGGTVNGSGGNSTYDKKTVDAYNTSLTKTKADDFIYTGRTYKAASVGNYAIFGNSNNSNAEVFSGTLTREVLANAGKLHTAATSIGDYALFGGGSGNSATVDTYRVAS